jgi:DNA-binding helix-hairpin-helix protein with protein kinase domain
MMNIESATEDIIFRGFSLNEILESNRRLHAALERAALENQLLKAILDAERKYRGHRSDCERCEMGLECAWAERLDEEVDKVKLKLVVFNQQNTGVSQ